MIKEEFLASSREVIGEYLKGIRIEKGISTYKIRKETNLQNGQIESIENGSANYSIDSLLNYTSAIGVYMFFGNKDGKEEGALDAEHMKKEAENNDPNL